MLMFDSDTPPVVYHYTNAAGLRGILDTSAAQRRADVLHGQRVELGRGAFSMRFTDASYLNDPLELHYMRAELASYIEQAIVSQSLDRSGYAEALDWLNETPDEVVASVQVRPRGGMYVACFSRDPDSLSQWRGYAGGRGYAIGFNTDVLRGLLAPMTERPPTNLDQYTGYVTPHMGTVFYRRDEAEQVLRDSANITIANNPHLALFQAMRGLALVKQEAYAQEQEVRAFLGTGTVPIDVEFRDGPLGLVPYITASYIPDYVVTANRFQPPRVDTPPLIREIWVGPGDDLGLRQAAAIRLLRERGFESDEVPVKPSNIVFRG